VLIEEASMRRWGWFLAVVILGGVMRGGFAEQVGATEHPPAPPRVTVVSGQTGGQVSLKVGSVLEVRLEANHTTGYSWIAAPAANPVLMRQGAAKYEEHPSGGKAGVGGVEVWRFKAVKAGKQGLSFEYRRPWEKNTPPAKVLTYSVTVE
jgi:inhibitor of cysteine peptidase